MPAKIILGNASQTEPQFIALIKALILPYGNKGKKNSPNTFFAQNLLRSRGAWSPRGPHKPETIYGATSVQIRPPLYRISLDC